MAECLRANQGEGSHRNQRNNPMHLDMHQARHDAERDVADDSLAAGVYHHGLRLGATNGFVSIDRALFS